MGDEKKNPNEYIHNTARTLMGQLHIRAEDWADPNNWPSASRESALSWDRNALAEHHIWRTLARALFHRYGTDVRDYVAKLKTGVRGFIACYGPEWFVASSHTTLVDVCNEQYTTERGGLKIVTRLAELTLMAAITDNLRADIRKFNDDRTKAA